MSNIDKIIQWIESSSGLTYTQDWASEDNMLECGILDSLKLMNLLVFIEEVIGRELNDEEINYADLTSVESIERCYINQDV